MSGSTTLDIISNLPRNVLEEILMRLTIQDAGRTSVLSRKWRYIWTAFPELVFMEKFCKESLVRARSDRLMMTIYKVLLLHHGPILKFTLSLSNLTSCPEIDQLIVFLSNNGIREFTLHVQMGIEPYKLASTLFSCQRLVRLNLSSCVFKPPSGFKGFTRLLLLALYEVSITGEVLSSLIPNCPLLESLTLHSSTSFGYLEIVAPNLKYFWCEGRFRSICFRNTSNLTYYLIELKGLRNQLGFDEEEISNSVTLPCSIPMVEFLAKTAYTFRLSKLQAFHSATASIDPVVELFDLRCWAEVSLHKFWWVWMEEVPGIQAEMEFIKPLLAKSPVLETMDIKLKPMQIAKELSIVKKFTGFQRASPHAVIKVNKIRLNSPTKSNSLIASS
ncbi:hypothetical protein RHSIM_RhsimUnG0011700 [Rhododendron simsii]|uniref:F-box domain-containing protein n=1 Tax=Rhododendron simsii TaxID=118357 RepID=A0A834L581_RHOSS|nr:hypothetical protein RHSIM_RhsimUnG0011700 [Rhododendron simsii]